MDKKETIIQSAIEIFREQGIEKTKISDIVKAAGIAQGTFYLYFPSKISLMPAIAEKMVTKTFEMVVDRVAEESSFLEQMSQFVDVIFEVNEEYQETLAFIYSGLASTEYLRDWEAVYSSFYEWVSQKLQHAMEKGEIRESIHPDRTARLVIGLVESAAEQIYLYDTANPDEAFKQKKEVKSFLHHALGIG